MLEPSEEIDYECIRGYTGHIKGICGKDLTATVHCPAILRR